MESENQEQEEEISELLLGIMEGYSDSVIPPLSQISTLHEPEIAFVEKGSSSRKRGRPPKSASRIENIQKERDRRGKMSDSYAFLQSMVPNLFPKVSGVISYFIFNYVSDSYPLFYDLIFHRIFL